jgi:hypothetical protein
MFNYSQLKSPFLLPSNNFIFLKELKLSLISIKKSLDEEAHKV